MTEKIGVMRRFEVAGVALTLISCMSLGSAFAAEDVPRINLRCNSVFPMTSALSWSQIRWGEEVERLSGGRITTEDMSLALYRAGEAPDALGGGLAKCGSMNLYYPDLYPVASDSGSMPFVWTIEMYADWVNIPFVGEVLREELADTNIVPLIGIPAPQSLFMAKKLPHGIAPDDMSNVFGGLRIRTWGLYTEVVRMLGGAPVAMPAPEVPLAVRQGLVDGFVTSWDTWKSQGTQYDAPYAYYLPSVGGSLFAFNQTEWNSYSEATRELMLEAARVVTEEIALGIREFNESVMQEARADPKLEVFDTKPEQAARWRTAMAPIWDEFRARSSKHEQYLDTLVRGVEIGYVPSWRRNSDCATGDDRLGCEE